MTEIEFCLNKSFYFIFYLNLCFKFLRHHAHQWKICSRQEFCQPGHMLEICLFLTWFSANDILIAFMLIECIKYKNIYVWKICREAVEYLLPLYKVRFLYNGNAILADSLKRKWKTYQLQIAVPVVYPRYVPQEELGRYSYMGTWFCKGKVNSGGMLALNRKLFIKYYFIYLKDHNQFFFQN